MSDDDMIRRGDARDVLSEEGWLGKSLERIKALFARGVVVKPLVWQPTYDGAGNLHRVTIAYCPVFEMNLYAERPEDQPRIEAKRAARILAWLEPAPTDAARAPAEDAHVKGETAGQMLERLGMDGVKWAAEFRTTALRLGYSDMDEGWLIGWFCNAIMAGYDRSAPTDASQARPSCPYGATGDDCCGGYCDMDDRRE